MIQCQYCLKYIKANMLDDHILVCMPSNRRLSNRKRKPYRIQFQ